MENSVRGNYSLFEQGTLNHGTRNGHTVTSPLTAVRLLDVLKSLVERSYPLAKLVLTHTYSYSEDKRTTN
jgi:hypothetical protein